MKSPVHNIILFGESGAGKSSLVNLIIGSDRAKTSSDPTGCTFKHQDYAASFDNFSCNIYDTAGLNEGDQGRVPHWRAIRELYTLIRKLDSVTLLIYCVRGRIKENTKANWTLFYSVICGGHVPVILVVTGLEQEIDWDSGSRLKRIKDSFDDYGMKPKDVATVVTIRGLNNEYLGMYKKSQTRLRDLISAHRRPWGTDKEAWFRDIYIRAYSEVSLLRCFGVGTQVEFGRKMGATLQQYIEQAGMKEGELKKLKDALLAAERKIEKQKTSLRTKLLGLVNWKGNPATAERQQESSADGEASSQADENDSQRLASSANPDENSENSQNVSGQRHGHGVQASAYSRVHDDREDKGGGSNAPPTANEGNDRDKADQPQVTKKSKRRLAKGLFSSQR